MKTPSVFCVVVTFNTEEDKLLRTIESIRKNSCAVIIVDNTGEENQIGHIPGVQVIHLRKNFGIAFAQNVGIRGAVRQGAEFVWLSDQDTIYPADYLARMLTSYERAKSEFAQVASVSPVYFDTNLGRLQPFVRQNTFTEKFQPRSGINPVSHSIASGMVIPVEALQVCGLMQESLFIDWVDLEWCWRCDNVYGWRNFGVGDVQICHTLGDQSVRFLWKEIGFHSPVRHYYMVRNAVHLACHSRSPTRPVRFEIFCKAIAWALIFPSVAPRDKLKHLAATVQGFIDGLLNRMGARPSRP